MSAQDRTLEQYHQLMQINAASHLVRAARSLGILAELRKGQRTLEQLSESLRLSREPASGLLDALIAIGIIEKYGDDYALSQAAQLLCQYDEDLGDARWQRLPDLVRGQSDRQQNDEQRHFDYLAATQWIHTPAAMEAAEILDIGGQGEVAGPKILDLGCGSAVWSCAMAYRDPEATISAVDNREALDAAESTANSIGILDRFEAKVSDPLEAELPADHFDWVVLAQRLSCLGPDVASRLVTKAAWAAKPGGRIVVIDLFRGPSRFNLAECVQVLNLQLETRQGAVLTLEQMESELREAGLDDIQFVFLSRSRANLGMSVATKPR